MCAFVVLVRYWARKVHYQFAHSGCEIVASYSVEPHDGMLNMMEEFNVSFQNSEEFGQNFDFAELSGVCHLERVQITGK